MTTPTAQTLTFTPPGPGSWDIDALHFPRPVTGYWADMHPEAFSAGYGDMAAFYGLPFLTRVTSYVNGFSYGQQVPLPDGGFADRVARADAVVDGKLWRAQAKEWEEVRKPASVQAHHEIQSVDPDQLTDDELAGYLRRCRDHHAAMVTQHMAFTGTAVIPPGTFVARVGEWTDLPTVQLLALMRGASPISGGDSPQHAALVSAFRADFDARARLDSDDDPGALLERLRTEPSATGQALNDYLNFAGYRLLDGFDISNRYALEMPDVLLRAIRAAIDAGDPSPADIDAQVAEVRGHVPDEHRAEFDELLADARLGYRVRDERGVYSDIWASGLMRRAALAAGRRLVARDRLREVEHVVFATTDEMCAMVGGDAAPTADELAGRHTFHLTYTAKDAPARLGDDRAPAIKIADLPLSMRRLMGAMSTSRLEMRSTSKQEHEETVLRGVSASTGVAEGIARRVAGPVDFDRIQQGDVLLTESTSEAFNILLPLLTAIITDSGGALSHAAIIAREYGIPGVVGTRDATVRIPDGARVLVDGDKGSVTVLD